MLTKNNLSHISNLKDLRAAKNLAVTEIEDAEKRLENLFSDLPMQAIGNAVGFVAGAVAKGFQTKNNIYSNESTENTENMTLGQTLQSVGQETAFFALSKLIEKLVANR